MALTLVGAGHLAKGSRVSLGLACLLVGLGFSSWLFEDCGMRR
ncbi:MAG TPA: hypothetical protein VG838_16130 [Opitutaceae bacterium]|nr:hypothetical protein [Opitutaceae bacterium]